jgi:nitrous oxidase accessory protein
MGTKNKGLALVLVAVFLTSLAVMPPATVKAQSKTITVPDDYPTIANAIGNATNGDTVFIRKGTYEEHSLIIKKSISLRGEGANATIIKNIDVLQWDSGQSEFPPQTETLHVSSDDVTISNLTISGGDKGISGYGNRIKIIGNTILASYDGVYLEGSNQIIAENSISAGSINNGIWLMYCNYSIIINNNISGDVSVGNRYVVHDNYSPQPVFNLVYHNVINGTIILKGNETVVYKNNATGISISYGSYNEVYANRIMNGGRGIGIMQGFNNTVYANLVEDNAVGVTMIEDSPSIFDKWLPTSVGQSSNNTVYSNNFLINNWQVQRANGVGYISRIEYNQSQPLIDYLGQINNRFDNGSEGNYWQDYTGIDSDNNTIGDTPYLLGNAIIDRYPLMNPFNISSVEFHLPTWAYNLTYVFPQITAEPNQETQTGHPESFPTLPVLTVSVTLVVVAAGLLVYHKKHKHNK